MRIEEMRSGLSRLKKNADVKGTDNIFEMRSLLEPDLWAVAERLEREMPKPPAEPTPAEVAENEAVTETRVTSELEAPRWAVVSFEKVEAAGLRYAQAVSVMADLELRGVTGLCIITDEAAARGEKS